MSTQPLAASFLESRGTIKGAIAGVIALETTGGLGQVSAKNRAARKFEGSSPVKAGDLAYLVVFPDQVVCYRAKRGAFKPKPTDEVLANAARASVTSATIERKKLSGVLDIGFADGSTWAFDVPKIYLNTAQACATALTA